MSEPERIAAMKMRRAAETCAEDARKRPGLYETNGHAIADLYDCIAKLCAIFERQADHE